MTDRSPSLPDSPPTAAGSPEERLLVPIGARCLPLAALAYVERRLEAGGVPSICLLHVEESLGFWASLRAFRAGDTTTRRHVAPLLCAAGERLARLGVRQAAYLRSGDVVFAILDAAEQLNCSAIVVPQIALGRWPCRGTLATLYERRRAIPLITVGDNGLPLRPRTG